MKKQNLEATVTVEEFQPCSTILRIQLQLTLLLPSWRLEDLVKAFWEAFREAARVCLERFLELLDDHLLEEKPQGYQVARRSRRKVKTSLGWLAFRLRQLRGPDGKGHYLPLLRVLGLRPRQRLADELVQGAVMACLLVSFRKARLAAGNPASLGHLWQAFQDHGAEVRRREEEALKYAQEGEPAPPRRGRTFAVLTLDEIYIRARKEGEGGLEGRRGSRTRATWTARLVVMEEKAPGRWEVEPVCCFTRHRTRARVFVREMKRFFDTVARLHTVDAIEVISDGCGWAQKVCELYPGRAVWQLDWWHLWRNVRRGCRIEEGLYEEVWDLLNAQRLDEALNLLRSSLEAARNYQAVTVEALRGVPMQERLQPLRRSSEERLRRQIDHLEKLIGYLERTRVGIYGVEPLRGRVPAELWVWGNGPVERLQGVMIGYRMKGQGRVWSEKGAQNMTAALQEFWNRESATPELAHLLVEQEEWERLDRQPNRSADHEGRGRDPARPASMPMLRRGRNHPTTRVLRALRNGGYRIPQAVAS